MVKKDMKGRIKARMKLRVTGALIIVTAFFSVLYLPGEVTKILGERMQTLGLVLAKVGVPASLAVIGSLLLFGQDHLATGKSKPSRFFRHYYPSTFAVKHCNKTQAVADDQWFTYFNKWEDPQHPNHSFYKSSFERSYDCRLFYYLVRFLWWYLGAAAVSVVLCTWILHTLDSDEMLVVRILMWVVALVITLSFSFANRIQEVQEASYADTYTATGAYHRYKEIQGVLREKFWTDILGPGGCPKPT